jgi:Flp pilus assembly protein TadD
MFSTCWNDKGAALHGLGQYQEAIICFDKALVINHGFAEAWFNKAISQESLGQNAAAADSWRNYLEVAMTNPRQSRFLKAVEDRLGELENVTIKSKVRGIFSKNETVHRPERPNGIDFFSADTWLKEGVDLYNRCRYEEALARFDRVLVIDPKSVNGCLNKGNALGELGRHEEAIVCYEKVLEIKPDCAEAWFNKGVPLEALGRSAEAIACFDRVIALNAQLVGAWLRRAGIHLKLGNKLAAISDYRKALEIGRKNPAEHPWIYLIERHVRSLEHP